MILADTSVWIGFWRGARDCAPMGELLRSGRILAHPWVTGELVLGGQPGARLDDLDLIEQALVVSHAEQRLFVRAHRLWHRRIGWVDAQLLASCRVSGASLWTRDRALAQAARSLGLASPLG